MKYGRHKLNAIVLAGTMICGGIGAMAAAPSAAAAANGAVSVVSPLLCSTQTIEVCDYWFGIPVHCHTETVTTCITP